MSDILINIISWFESDENPDGDDQENTDRFAKYKNTYVLRLFGRTDDDKSITVRIDDFIPHFYLKIPTRWTDYQIGKFVNTVLKIHVRNIRIH